MIHDNWPQTTNTRIYEVFDEKPHQYTYDIDHHGHLMHESCRQRNIMLDDCDK